MVILIVYCRNFILSELLGAVIFNFYGVWGRIENWDEFIKYCIISGYTNYILFTIEKYELEKYIPKDVIKRLKIYALIIKNEWSKKIENYLTIQEIINKKKYEALIIKGGAINLIYKSDMCRSLSDIDVLFTNDSEANELYNLLICSKMFKSDTDDEQKAIFQKTMFQHYPMLSYKDFKIEIHNKITMFCEENEFNYKSMYNRSINIGINNIIIKIPSIEDQIIISAHHIYHDEYLCAKYIIKSHIDIIHLIKTNKIDWEYIISNKNFSVEYGIYYCDYIYQQIYDKTLIPNEILKLLLSKDFDSRINEIRLRFSFGNIIEYWSDIENRYEDRMLEGDLFDLKLDKINYNDIKDILRKNTIIAMMEKYYKTESEKRGICFEREFRFEPYKKDQVKDNNSTHKYVDTKSIE